MTELITIMIPGYKCLRCGWEWKPRKRKYPGKPRLCPNPKCRSAYWDVERIEKKAE